jgi:RNA polymerase sigma factor (sigma-70 family)
MRSVVNAALNAIRRKRNSASLDADPSILEKALGHATSVEAQVEFEQLAREVLLALSRLPARQRTAIVQCYYLELNEREMAQALDAAPGMIKWLLPQPAHACARCSVEKGGRSEAGLSRRPGRSGAS